MSTTETTKAVGIFKKFRNDFQEFAFNNRIIVQATGVVFGLATKDFIEKVLTKIILPSINKTSHFLLINHLPTSLKSYTGTIKTLADFIWDIFVWFIIIILTFFILEYFFNRTFLGLRTKLNEEGKKEFVKAKKLAKESIIPDKEQIKEIVKEEKKEALEDAIEKNTKNESKDVIELYHTKDAMHMLGGTYALL